MKSLGVKQNTPKYMQFTLEKKIVCIKQTDGKMQVIPSIGLYDAWKILNTGIC